MDLVVLLNKKIEEGRNLIAGIDTMREVPSRVMNVVSYDRNDVEKQRTLICKWQNTTIDIIISGFGDNHRYFDNFKDTITNKNTGFNFKREFDREVNSGIAVLEGIVESTTELGLGNIAQKESSVAKSPMVFISHSSKDKDFADALVVLLEDIGFDSSNLFCSSIDGYGIGLSEDIFETLRSLFKEHDLYVIFIHSPRYYESAVSLNEMGAAWVLKTDFCSILTSDMEFSKMTGVVNDSKISIKVNNDDAPARLTELKDKLISMFELKAIDTIKWERKRQMFLDRVANRKNDAKTFNDNKESLRKGYADAGPA
jgi:hypothetical protein